MRALIHSLANDSLSDISAVIVNSVNGQSSQQQLANSAGEIPVVQDDSIWKNMQGNRDDVFVYDRCNRLAFYLPYPLSLLNGPYVKSAILATYHDSPCGACQLEKTNPEETRQQQTSDEPEDSVQLITRCEANPDDPSSKICHVDIVHKNKDSADDDSVETSFSNNDDVTFDQNPYLAIKFDTDFASKLNSLPGEKRKNRVGNVKISHPKSPPNDNLPAENSQESNPPGWNFLENNDSDNPKSSANDNLPENSQETKPASGWNFLENDDSAENATSSANDNLQENSQEVNPSGWNFLENNDQENPKSLKKSERTESSGERNPSGWNFLENDDSDNNRQSLVNSEQTENPETPGWTAVMENSDQDTPKSDPTENSGELNPPGWNYLENRESENPKSLVNPERTENSEASNPPGWNFLENSQEVEGENSREEITESARNIRTGEDGVVTKDVTQNNEKSVSDDQNLGFPTTVCKSPEIKVALKQLYAWYHKRKLPFDLEPLQLSEDGNINLLQNSTLSPENNISESNGQTAEETQNNEMLQSCPDYNKIRCGEMESKFLRTRHCCHMISKSQMKGKDAFPKKCIDLTLEKCTKLKTVAKCCREEQTNFKDGKKVKSKTKPVQAEIEEGSIQL